MVTIQFPEWFIYLLAVVAFLYLLNLVLNTIRITLEIRIEKLKGEALEIRNLSASILKKLKEDKSGTVNKS